MGANLLLLLLLTVLSVSLAPVFSSTRDDVCGDISGTIDGGDLNLNLPSQLSANIESVVPEEGIVMNTEWSFDSLQNKIMLTTKNVDKNYVILYDYTYGQTMFYDLASGRGTCTLTNSNDETNGFWLLPEPNADKDTKLTSLNALRLQGGSGFTNENIKLQDEGTSTIRDVSVNKYTSCQRFKSNGEYMIAKVTHYLSDATFTRLETGSVPIQIVFEAQVDSGSGTTYTHTLNFFHYATAINANTNFETPLGVVCEGRVGGSDFPDVPTYISFIQEIHYPASWNNKLEILKTIYDQEGNYVYEETFDDSSYRNPYRYDDFNTGLTYEIDPDSRLCSVQNISSAQKVNDYIVADANGDVRIATPKEFFGDEGVDYHYTGEYIFRGVQTDAWVAYSADGSGVYEWYFLKGLEYDVNMYASDMNGEELSIPYKRLLWNGMETTEYYATYLFEVDYSIPYFFVDLALCYTDNYEFISLYIPGAIEDITLSDITVITRGAQKTIADALGVSRIRINYPRIYFYGGKGTLTFNLLGSPPYASDVANIAEEPNLDDAIDILVQKVEDKTIMLSVGNDEAEIISEVEIDYLHTDKYYYSSSSTSAPKSYTSGDMGGLAFAMAAIGICAGGAGGWWFFIHRT